jgi:secretion/DNA translocation related TadE-like protein
VSELDDRGSGSLLAIALVGSVTALAALGLPVFVGLAIRQSVAGAADAAALAAADVLSGLETGFPCDAAQRVAEANAALLASCAADGLTVTVSATREFAGITVRSFATAGPPLGEPD